MAKLAGEQLSLIAEVEIDDRTIGDWDWDDVGTDKILVPTSLPSKIGTKNISVPTSQIPEIGTKKSSVPIFTVDFRIVEKFTPPIGLLEQKWQKDRKYWYWRYYDNRGKKRSLYLAKDYNKAISKCLKIGIPADAKLPKSTTVKADPQAQTPSGENLIDITQTAHGASRSRRAA